MMFGDIHNSQTPTLASIDWLCVWQYVVMILQYAAYADVIYVIDIDNNTLIPNLYLKN